LDSNRLIRSKKLQTLSDAQIIKRYADRPLGEERHFLDIEIEQRNLKDQADSATKKKQLLKLNSAISKIRLTAPLRKNNCAAVTRRFTTCFIYFYLPCFWADLALDCLISN